MNAAAPRNEVLLLGSRESLIYIDHVFSMCQLVMNKEVLQQYKALAEVDKQQNIGMSSVARRYE